MIELFIIMLTEKLKKDFEKDDMINPFEINEKTLVIIDYKNLIFFNEFDCGKDSYKVFYQLVDGKLIQLTKS